MLIAIGIYHYDHHHQFDNIRFTKAAFAQLESSLSLFVPNLLEPIEKNTLTSLTFTELNQTMPVHFEQSGEQHYVKPVPGECTIIVISSRSVLDKIELHHLLNNIWYAFKQPIITGVTLQQIINNPIGYTGRDCKIAAINDELNELKGQLIETIESLIERGERIEDLRERTAGLQSTSVKFELKTKKMNDRCCGMW